MTCSLPFFAAVILLPLITGQGWVLLFGLAALLHEGGHLLALWLLGGRAERFCLRLSGAEIRYSGSRLSYGGEALLALAGPLANLICACLCVPAARLWPDPRLYRFIGCHLTLALFNLLPALPLDGGRVLEALLEARFPLRGREIAQAISAGIGLVLLGFGAVLLVKGGNLTLLAAGGVIFLRSGAKNALHLPKKLIK